MKMKTNFFYIYFLELENWDRALAHFLSDDGAAQTKEFSSLFFQYDFCMCKDFFLLSMVKISVTQEQSVTST